MVILQDFNMVKIESRPRTISIRQAFLIGNESYSGMRIWCLVRVGSSPTASTKYICILKTVACELR